MTKNRPTFDEVKLEIYGALCDCYDAGTDDSMQLANAIARKLCQNGRLDIDVPEPEPRQGCAARDTTQRMWWWDETALAWINADEARQWSQLARPVMLYRLVEA